MSIIDEIFGSSESDIKRYADMGFLVDQRNRPMGYNSGDAIGTAQEIKQGQELSRRAEIWAPGLSNAIKSGQSHDAEEKRKADKAKKAEEAGVAEEAEFFKIQAVDERKAMVETQKTQPAPTKNKSYLLVILVAIVAIYVLKKRVK